MLELCYGPHNESELHDCKQIGIINVLFVLPTGNPRSPPPHVVCLTYI